VDESNLNMSAFSQDQLNLYSINQKPNSYRNEISQLNIAKFNYNDAAENSENLIKSENFANKNANLIAKVNSKINKDKEFKYKKLSQEMQDFCKLLDDYSRDNLIHKLNEKLKTNLNYATFNEIKELEAKISNTS
jgi:hypothetical protein